MISGNMYRKIQMNSWRLKKILVLSKSASLIFIKIGWLWMSSLYFSLIRSMSSDRVMMCVLSSGSFALYCLMI